MMRSFAVSVTVLLLAGQGALADWRGFYTPSARPEPAARAVAATDPRGICLNEILRAQLRHQIPGNLLLGIGLQEAGMMKDGDLTVWPWVANAEGDGRYFGGPGEAMEWVQDRLSSGIASVDVGCMQINLRWHPDAFDTLAEGFDPARNVDYAARLLVSLYRDTGDWVAAAGRYHSATQEYQKIYLDRLRTNVGIANERLEEFRMMASAAAGAGQGAPAPIPREPLPQGHFWTAWLAGPDGGAGQGARSLYARGTLEPVLPAFRRMF
ncbi:hypothetical protein ATO6_20195 [Oceanicola sp. 22II-s10i]|uniref:hypothetical protein n=1 Tax=Oceanicola sp. 22II-s10i TaxID=1317116 RepID=UPI000B521BC3|nr:hypothetical protein [Oceanicola sp. 22II-s10i]OWU83166.1 hypothetical protein ATO6_20195 [Oceanicola sp. 22II-s10i]